jgi:hypothetical protein
MENNSIASAIARIEEMKKQHAELTEFNSGYKNAIINVLGVLYPLLQEPKLKAGEFNDKGIEQLVQDYIGDEAIGDMEDILDGFGRYLRDRGLLRNTEPADLDFKTFAKEMDEVFALPSSETENTPEDPLKWEYAIARHFIQWQKKQDAKYREDNNICCMKFDFIEDARLGAYEQGKHDMKAELIEYAVPGYIDSDGENTWARSENFCWLNASITEDFHIGQKVKLLIIPSEDKDEEKE